MELYPAILDIEKGNVIRRVDASEVPKIFTHDFYYAPKPWPLKKGTFDSNAAINLKGFGDLSSTQNNQI